MKSRIIRWIVLLIIGVSIGAAITYFKRDKDLEGDVTPLETASILKKPASAPIADENLESDIGGPFTLVDQNGQTVTQDNYKDSYKLVFFGFTYCPAICPTELQKIAKVMQGLGEISSKIQPLFITVDPERDTPARLKEYVAQFHPKQIGLTGSPEQIEAVKQSFRVYASKVEMPGGDKNNYMMDHSSFTYLMSPDNRLVAIYPSTDTAEKIIEDLKNRSL